MERPPTVTVAVRISFDPIKCRGYYPYTHIATSPTYGPVQLRIT